MLPDVNPLDVRLYVRRRNSSRITDGPIHAYLIGEDEVKMLCVENRVGARGVYGLIVEIPSDLSRRPEHAIGVVLRQVYARQIHFVCVLVIGGVNAVYPVVDCGKD